MKIKKGCCRFILILSLVLFGCSQKGDENAPTMPEELPVQADVTEEPAKEGPEQKKEPATIEVRSLYEGRYKMILTEDLKKWIEDDSLPVPEPEERNWDLLAGKEAEKQALRIGADEEVVKEEIYDFPICDYIEVEYETFDDELKRRFYIAIYDRSGELKASCYCKNMEKNLEEYIEKHGFRHVIEELVYPYSDTFMPRPLAKVCKNTGEMEEKELYGWIYLEDGNEMFHRYGVYQEEPPSDDYIIKQDTGRLYDSESDITVSLNCYYIELVNFPYAEKINKRIREYTEEQQHSLLEDAKIKFAPKAESQEDNEDDYYMDYRSGLFYQDTSYIAVEGGGYCHLIGTSLMDAVSNSWFLYFNLKTGEEVKAEDFLGKGCGFEELKNTAWIGYQKLMEEEPDKYTKRAFDDYYEKVPKDKITYYFSEEGMVFYYRYYGYGNSESWEDLPVEYRLNENLKEEHRMDLVVPYEVLKQIGKE